ncbi:Phosphoinositide phosphatase SAC2 [Camellia lanceoleosa]|uniref:Phosphoinositide phosphatase SAC2 n=1 Tax=Camellia lanceoleosa TaxID=1840588 RepID=A0ACC0ICS8_9ERIC|nr:Phosphoinositide phosphatase SAC2 [Camellia lanceoleosa]
MWYGNTMPLPDKMQGLSKPTPEISTCESELSYSKYTPSMSSRQLFPDMQQNQYLENDRVCLDGHRDSFHCSNFWDVDWLSSSGNSCEEETYKRKYAMHTYLTTIVHKYRQSRIE